MRKWIKAAAVWLAFASFWAQGATQVASEASLISAIAAAAVGDRIEITQSILVNSEIVLSRDITISGGGHLLSVPRPGVNEDGSNRASGASPFRVFTVNAPAVVVLEDMHIKGGYTGDGGALNVAFGATATLNRVTISNSRSPNRAGGLANFGTVYLNDGRLMRNSAFYAGGFVNRGGKMFINRSTFSDNRSESPAGGGGAGESEAEGGRPSVMFVNNSTFANNKSTEHGGAIKNNGSALYVSNSTFTGNVAYGNPGDSRGGAIGITGSAPESKVFLVNNVFAYNYREVVAGFELDDFHWHAGSNGELYGYYNVYHGSRGAGSGWADKPGSFKADLNNLQYAALADGSDDSVFSGGFLSKVTDGFGAERGTARVFQPHVVNDSGYAVPSLKANSWLLDPATRGVRTAVLLDAATPSLAYSANNDWTTWTDLAGSPGGNVANHVTLDQLGGARIQPPQNLPPVRGATSYVLENLFQVKVVPGAGGQVQGGNVYGEVYPSGTSVTLTALANTGQTLVGWYDESGNPLSSNVTYTFTVLGNVWVQPRFAATSDGRVAVTYAGNGITTGTVPATVRVVAGASHTTAAGNSGLLRAGYALSSWNTEPNGAGTSYSLGQTIFPIDNLSLFAQWTPIRTATVTVNSQSVTLSMSCLNCALTSASVEPVPAGAPAGTDLRYQLQRFELIDVQGPVQVTLTFPEAIPAGETLWKLKGGVWSAVAGAVLSGSSVTYTVVDNGPLDEADTVTGVIRDPVAMAFGPLAVAPGGASIVGVPVDSDALRWMAAFCIAVCGGWILRARARNGHRI